MDSSYNKLFLLANYWNDKFPRYIDCTTINDYTFCEGSPTHIINNVFNDYSKIPVDMSASLENNKHIDISIENIKDLDTFLNTLKEGFVSHLYLYK